MQEDTKLLIHVAETESGRCLISSNTAPHFCFEADTQEEALGIVRRALSFYEEAYKEGAPSRPARKFTRVDAVWRSREQDRLAAVG